ncbi:hypothetical protein QCA50_007350 [Cerrena zonata]|uniref:Uncharacterized protein n=1 Tax=Cerrena zonata TaxID=2478898 RepID=A0AAW0G7D0_9APHY
MGTKRLGRSAHKSHTISFLTLFKLEIELLGTSYYTRHTKTQYSVLSDQEAQDDMQEAIDFAIAQGGSGVIDTLPSWDAFFAKYVLSAQAAVGPEVMLGTRLISTSLFETETGRETLAQTIKNTLPFASPYIVLSVKGQLNFSSTLEERKLQYSEVTREIQAFRNITPMGSGAYFNKGDAYESNHEESFWVSDNYARLLEVKRN